MKKLVLAIDELRVDSFITSQENMLKGGGVLGNDLTVSNVETCLATCGNYCTAAAGTCAAFTCADATCGCGNDSRDGLGTCAMTNMCDSGLCGWLTDFCSNDSTCWEGCNEQNGG
jgi:hypothetical protein